jgi:YD repeat-containing protein
MKILPLLSGVILTMSFFSCKKGDDSSVSVASLPKTYTEDLRSAASTTRGTFNLTYDSKGRLTSMTAIPEPSILKFVYQYPSDNTVMMDMYELNQLSIHENFWLNSFSLVDSTFQYDNTNDTSTEKYFYDGNHLLTKYNSYDYYKSVSTLSNQTQYTYDNNGNAITQTDNTGTTSYTYYADLPYTLSTGLPFISASKNFIKTTSDDASGTPETATHYYLFDSNNRLTQDSAYVSGTDVILIKTYTY